MEDVERQIRRQLLSGRADDVKDGLSSVLFWGYARTGYRDVRVRRFRESVSSEQLLHASRLFRDLTGPGLRRIAALELPEFSGMSFVSKVRMFLDPVYYTVLDNRLLSLRAHCRGSTLAQFAKSKKETLIRISKPNEDCYARWCEKCHRLSIQCWGEAGRAVDVERAVFGLIDGGNVEAAARIAESL